MGSLWGPCQTGLIQARAFERPLIQDADLIPPQLHRRKTEPLGKKALFLFLHQLWVLGQRAHDL